MVSLNITAARHAFLKNHQSTLKKSKLKTERSKTVINLVQTLQSNEKSNRKRGSHVKNVSTSAKTKEKVNTLDSYLHSSPSAKPLLHKKKYSPIYAQELSISFNEEKELQDDPLNVCSSKVLIKNIISKKQSSPIHSEGTSR